MKKKLFLLQFLIVAGLINLFSACSKDSQGEVVEPPVSDVVEDGLISVKVEIDFGTSSDISNKNYKIATICEEKKLNGMGSLPIQSMKSDNPQLTLIVDNNEQIMLLSRNRFEQDESANRIDARSSAIAMVTMHPLFAPVRGSLYSNLEEMVVSSRYFTLLEAEVSKSIENGRPLYDSENTALLTALTTVFEDLCSNAEDGEFEPISRAITRASSIEHIDEGPFSVDYSGNKLLIKNHNLTPMYEGWVTSYDGDRVSFDIQSNSDYGVMNIFGFNKPEEFEFSFTKNGEYHFDFDRTTGKANWDFTFQILGNLCDIIGLPLSLKKKEDAKMLESLAVYLGPTLGSLISSVGSGGELQATEAISSLFAASIGFFSEPNFTKWVAEKGFWAGAKSLATKLAMPLQVYSTLRGSVNASMRLYWRWQSPEQISFCLYYYGGKISTCAAASFIQANGDNQQGYENQRLLSPLELTIRTISSNDGEPIDAVNFHKVKYEVFGGGTINGEATGVIGTEQDNISVYWKLGQEDQEQSVRMVVVDIVTGDEISEPYIYHATIANEQDVTFRLDWDKTLSRTDIDLHIYDPLGHHIWHVDTECPCGGWLDRDDRQGPGPEHIRYQSAPKGTYTIKVHHYNSESHGVIGYTVTVYANDKMYKATGAVAYNQLNTVGTITIPDVSTARGAVPEWQYIGTMEDGSIIPRTKKVER